MKITDNATPPPIIRGLPAVSLIVPMYNAEKYVEEALRSVLGQSFADYEVIVVDDCSTDASGKIVQGLAGEFAGRLKYARLRRNSGGGGKPRNVGLALSRGKYVTFMDSDDVLVNDAFEKLYGAAERHNADVVHTEAHYVYGERQGDAVTVTTKRDDTGKPVNGPVLETKDISRRVADYIQGRYYWYSWNKLYRRDFLAANEIRYPLLPSSEDMGFNFFCLCLAENYLRIPDITYVYRAYDASLTHSLKGLQSLKKLHKILFDGARELDDFMASLPFLDEHPQLRHDVVNYYTQINLNSFAQILYATEKITDINGQMRRLLAESGNRDAALTAFLFDAFNLYIQQERRRQYAEERQTHR